MRAQLLSGTHWRQQDAGGAGSEAQRADAPVVSAVLMEILAERPFLAGLSGRRAARLVELAVRLGPCVTPPRATEAVVELVGPGPTDPAEAAVFWEHLAHSRDGTLRVAALDWPGHTPEALERTWTAATRDFGMGRWASVGVDPATAQAILRHPQARVQDGPQLWEAVVEEHTRTGRALQAVVCWPLRTAGGAPVTPGVWATAVPSPLLVRPEAAPGDRRRLLAALADTHGLGLHLLRVEEDPVACAMARDLVRDPELPAPAALGVLSRLAWMRPPVEDPAASARWMQDLRTLADHDAEEAGEVLRCTRDTLPMEPEAEVAAVAECFLTHADRDVRLLVLAWRGRAAALGRERRAATTMADASSPAPGRPRAI